MYAIRMAAAVRFEENPSPAPDAAPANDSPDSQEV